MKKAFLKLHISVLLAGMTGIFGKLITLNGLYLTWYRLCMAAVVFFIILLFLKKLPRVSVRDFLKIAGVGALLGLHWIFFYSSIKASNVSIGVVCFSVTSLFTALLEPLFNRHRCSPKEIAIGLLTLAGILCIFQFDTRYRVGVVLGIISSLLVAMFTILNKKVGERHSSSTLLLYEMTGGAATLTLIALSYSLLFPAQRMAATPADLIYLLLLATFCTVLLCLLQIEALQKISAFTVNLTYNLEPVYSIVLAMLLFGEAKELNFSFYVGLALIILSVALQTMRVIRNR